MIVKNRPLLKIERVFVDFRKIYKTVKKKKKKVMNVTVFPGNIRDKMQHRRKQILSEIPSLEMLR